MALVKIKQIDGLTASLAVITTNTTAITNLEASVDSLEDIVALGTGALEASVDSLEGDVSSIDTRVLAAEGDISDLSASVDSLEGDVSSIDTRIGDVEGDVSTLQGDVSDLSASVDSLEGDVSSIDTRIGDVEGDVSTNAADIDSLEASVNSIETALTTYFKDNVATGYIVDLSQDGDVLDTDGSTLFANYTAVNPAGGEGRFTLVEPLEGTNATEWERNLLGVFINGVKLDPTEVTVALGNDFSINAPYAFDENDILEIRYNKAG